MKSNISIARITAYKVLFDVFEKKAFSNISLSNHLNSAVKNPSDRALCSNIVYGTIKKRNLIKEILNSLSDKPFEKTDSRVNIILMMSLYQLMCLNKVPDYAVVNDAVEMTKFFAIKSAANYVNAILRSFLRRKQELINHGEYDIKQLLYYESGFDEEISDILIESYDDKRLKAMARYFTDAPRVYIRVNTLSYTCEETMELLLKEDIQTFPTYVLNVLEVKSKKNIFASEAYKKGAFFAQDISGAISSYVLSPSKTDAILDLCAAPGAKSFGAAIISGGAQVTSCDISIPKLDMLYQSAKQMGLKNIKTLRNDATVKKEEFKERFDKVICDVPCSGLGVIARKPDILLNLNASNIASLIEVQKKIILSGIDALKKGGSLLYSTCTLNPKENIKTVEYALGESGAVEMEEITLPFKLKCTHKEMRNGILMLNPADDDCDGFFIAKLKKVK